MFKKLFDNSIRWNTDGAPSGNTDNAGNGLTQKDLDDVAGRVRREERDKAEAVKKSLEADYQQQLEAMKAKLKEVEGSANAVTTELETYKTKAAEAEALKAQLEDLKFDSELTKAGVQPDKVEDLRVLLKSRQVLVKDGKPVALADKLDDIKTQFAWAFGAEEPPKAGGTGKAGTPDQKGPPRSHADELRAAIQGKKK